MSTPMIKEFILSLLFNILPFIRKLIYPQKKFKSDIEIDVRSSNPVSFSLNSEIPTANIYLKITNKSQYLKAGFNKAILSLWLRHDRGSQPLLKQAYIITERTIGQKQSEEIFCEVELKESQISLLEKIKESRELTATLNLEIYIDSSLHHIVKKVSLENKPCKIL